MGKDTKIEWADSTQNLQMGCDGCELWTEKLHQCYAGVLTERYAGLNGWPASFNQPATFPYRLDAAEKWPDLTGTDRPNKPWLNGLPRQIFLDDMGDTFTESLPIDWLAEHSFRMGATPHTYMVLTKRPRRAVKFADLMGAALPTNFYFGTSVTTQATVKRAADLVQIATNPLFLSVEPLLEPVTIPLSVLQRYRLVIIGGESGNDARPCNFQWIQSLIEQCRNAGIGIFVKQLGANVYNGPRPENYGKKGGDWTKWPKEFRIREFPDPRRLA